MEVGYFLIADVLGFSKIVVNSSASEPNGKIETWLTLVEEAQKSASLDRRPQLISDTVFACASDDVAGFKQLVGFARSLLELGHSKSLLVRGAITHGPFEWGELTYGQAVIAAHQLEANQDWIGISCQADIPNVDSLWGPDGLVCYPPPLKQGMIGLHPVVVWDVPHPHELQAASTTAPLVNKNEFLEWPWLRRLRNTVHFQRYLTTLLSDEKPRWQSFSGSIF